MAKTRKYASGGSVSSRAQRAQNDRINREWVDPAPVGDALGEREMRKGESIDQYNERQYKAERAGKVPKWTEEGRDDYEMETGRKPRGKAYAKGGLVARGCGAAVRGKGYNFS